MDIWSCEIKMAEKERVGCRESCMHRDEFENHNYPGLQRQQLVTLLLVAVAVASLWVFIVIILFFLLSYFCFFFASHFIV